MIVVLFQHSWKVHFISLYQILYTKMRWYCQTVRLYIIKRFKLKLQKQFINWRPKTGFQRLKKKPNSQKSFFFKRPPKNYLSYLVLEILIQFVFIKMVWLISTNWCFHKKKKLLPNSVGCIQMYLDLNDINAITVALK